MKMEKDNRGFKCIEIEDTRGCFVRVKRSSAHPLDKIWIFFDDPHNVYSDGKGAPHLNKKQAVDVARALLAFVNEEDK